MNVDWRLKIKAFLYQLPWGVLCDQEPNDEERKELMKAIVGDDDLAKAREANERAFGMDVPPHIRDCSHLWGAFSKEPLLKHPLSGEKMDLKISGFESDRCREGKDRVQEVVGRLAKDGASACSTPEATKKAFLTLWRTLPEELAKENPLWVVLPADPRVPDHPIWDHASMASAFAATGDRPAFLLLNIASAQQFLATARRTQDLWMGSFLLSYLIWKGIEVIAEECGPDCIIMPQLREQPLVDRWLIRDGILAKDRQPDLEQFMVANLPNVFTALVPFEEGKCLAEGVVGKIRDSWEEIAKAVREHVQTAIASDTGLRKKIDASIEETETQGRSFLNAASLESHLKALAGDSCWGALWTQETEEFLTSDIFWVVLPWYSNNADMDGVVKKLEDLLGGAPTGFDALWRCCAGKHNIGMFYGPLSALAGRTLSSRKNLRDFAQVSEEDDKCTLCGVRTALHPSWINRDERNHYAELRVFWDVLAQIETNDIKLRGRIRRGDRLCAVCLTKRLAWEAYFIRELGLQAPASHILFPSTSTVATAAFKHRVVEEIKKQGRAGDLLTRLGNYNAAMKKLLEQPSYDINLWSAAMPKTEAAKHELNGVVKDQAEQFLRFDGDWLYTSSFDREAIEHEFRLPERTVNAGAVSKAARALQELLEAAAKCEIPGPAGYYAMIAMDADHMGEWVTGQKSPGFEEVVHPEVTKNGCLAMPKVNRPLGPVTHIAIATAGRNLALHVARQVVEQEHPGKLIYAGGDDILAFVPLEHLLDVLMKLRRRFGGETNGFDKSMKDAQGRERSLLMMGNTATTSAGVVIAHHTHPLSQVVEEAQRTLKDDAKKGLGRDAFAVQLLKRSGERVVAGARWTGTDGQNTVVCPLEKLKEVVEWLQGRTDGSLSDRFVTQLAEERALAGLPLPAQEAEVLRLVRRHLHVNDLKSKDSLTSEVGDTMLCLLRALSVQEVIRLMMEKLALPQWSERKKQERLAEYAGRIVLPRSGSACTTSSEEKLRNYLCDAGGLGAQDERWRSFYGEFSRHNEFDRFISLLQLARFLASGGRRE